MPEGTEGLPGFRFGSPLPGLVGIRFLPSSAPGSATGRGAENKKRISSSIALEDFILSLWLGGFFMVFGRTYAARA
jgi:hypothetical protein